MNRGFYPNNQTLYFESGLFTLTASSQVAKVRHGLPRTPQSVNWVLQCQTAEQTFTVGQEVPIEDLAANDGNNVPLFTRFQDAVFAGLNLQADGMGAIDSTGTTQTLTLAKWKAKCYAWIQQPQ